MRNKKGKTYSFDTKRVHDIFFALYKYKKYFLQYNSINGIILSHVCQNVKFKYKRGE